MIVELQMTAIHEAAHITLAVLSRFHELSFGWIRISLGPRGEAPFMRSKPKLQACAKDNRAGRPDKEVAREAAVIYLAGFVAERHLCRRHPEYAAALDEAASAHDLTGMQAELAAAGLDDEAEIDLLMSAAEEAIAAHWDVVTLVARTLLHAGGWEIHPSRAEEIVQRHACGYWSVPETAAADTKSPRPDWTVRPT